MEALTTMLLLGFGLLAATFLFGVVRLWQIHRRGVAREKEMRSRMMEESLSVRKAKAPPAPPVEPASGPQEPSTPARKPDPRPRSEPPR